MPERLRTYRSKSMKPCDACRTRKIACIQEFDDAGKISSCTLCRHRNVPCTFVSRPARRKKASSSESVESDNPVSMILSPKPDWAKTVLTGEDEIASSTPTGLPFCETVSPPDYSSTLPSNSSSYFRTAFSTPPSASSISGLDGDYHGFQEDFSRSSHNKLKPSNIFDYITISFSSLRKEIVELYYSRVHPALPIIERRETFEAKVANGQIPSHLAALVLLHSAYYSPSARRHAEELCIETSLEQEVFTLLALETRCPTLYAIQTGLLCLELPLLRRNSDPNQSESWGLHAMIVSMAQAIHLHRGNPKAFCKDLSIEEERLRRIVWWNLFIRDKWMAFFIGRPSHIAPRSWDTPMLTLEDFSDKQDCLPIKAISWGNALLAVLNLTLLLADVMETFYSVDQNTNNLDLTFSVSQGLEFIKRLGQWKQDYPYVPDSTDTYHYTAHMLSYSVCLAVHRGLDGAYVATQNNEANILHGNIARSIRRGFLGLLRNLELQFPRGLWLSFNTGNLIVVAKAVMPVVLASHDDDMFKDRAAILDELQAHLKGLLLAEQRRTDMLGQVTLEFVKPSLSHVDEMKAALLAERDRRSVR